MMMFGNRSTGCSKWRDKDLYPFFWLGDYSRHYVPWGVQGLYWLASRFVDPISFSKVLSGLLFVLSSLTFHRIGQILKDRLAAWTVLAVFWLMPFFLFRISGGLARGFAFPLMALFLLFWLCGRGWAMGMVLLMMSLTIPYIFILSLFAVAMARGTDLMFTKNAKKTPFPIKTGHYALVGMAVLMFFLLRQQFTSSGFGPLVAAQDMVGAPEFGPHGRYPILPVPNFLWTSVVFPWEWIGPFRGSDSVVLNILGCMAVLGAAFYGATHFQWHVLKGKWQPFYYVILSSLLFYILARGFLLKLFIPSRYLTYTVSVFYCVVLGLCLRGVLGQRLRPLAAAVLLVMTVGLSGLRLHGVGLHDYSQYETLYVALNQTPKNSLVAGHPYLMDNVLTFGRRNVFASFELAHPWSKGLWKRLKPELIELFNAYYAEDPAVVNTFCRKYHIDFFVVDIRHFTDEFLKERPFFAPFDRMIQTMVQNRRQFVLVSGNSFPVTEINEYLRVIDVRRLSSGVAMGDVL